MSRIARQSDSFELKNCLQLCFSAGLAGSRIANSASLNVGFGLSSPKVEKGCFT